MIDNYSDDRKIGKLYPETIEKMRVKALNMCKKKCIVNTRSVILYNLGGTVYGKYLTIIEAAKAINCNEKTIRRALNTPKNLVKRQWIVK